jgi:hypothetical protein
MNLRKPDAPARVEMSKVTNMPAPPPSARPNRAIHDTYAEEALRSAQRVIDMTQEIDRLGQELEDWRRRALMTEAEVKKLEKREIDLRAELEQRTLQLTDERDSYRSRLTMLVAQFHSAGAMILKCLETAQGQAGPMVNLTNLANELEHEQKKPDEKLMRAITGPRSDEETKAG